MLVLMLMLSAIDHRIEGVRLWMLALAASVIVAAPAYAQDYRLPPPMPGPYSYGYPGCPGGYVSILGDICEPYFPPMRNEQHGASGCPQHRKPHGHLCKS
jgi:hypothetical protein